MYKLVLLRHGQSTFNAKDIFTGWRDPSLSEKGKQESKKAGKLLKQANFSFDLVFTSKLKRAKQTLALTLKEMGLKIPLKENQALNERHYGALQGKHKNDILKEYGLKKFTQFRRSWAIKPPALKKPEKKGEPLTESLKDTWQRIRPYWQKEIIPQLKFGKNILISGHGSTIRAFIKYFDGLSKKEVEGLNVPCGFPLVYLLDNRLKPIKKYYLGNLKEIKKATRGVAEQGK
ncbi:phosphoglyceromutase [bacterium (Candidatus Gribaldobacteria) CG10_big_fil_rev_8_21_14_0_10_37_21]|uniref:2,3-bisphosphoglycerate-dependent phosphoglycerate mutase n=1 Tax=bacterium (Candidatus Gribaldobacteria) CG10_big_fil_rev_8_21_14_0_10_37_21 TaxID=2014275 RepID=A0A2H0UTB6_9BACT|nr:MAG: hypothetical protein AUJ25_01180 [Parcubacteria group bacterium CG1_02_37_13]PIR89852.1 MAG: phosphoglyceromutase [bacterium (Candidatus Gribaldobacteria) CG10_big_fil_rev_8_21_14_0_10_37_21]